MKSILIIAALSLSLNSFASVKISCKAQDTATQAPARVTLTQVGDKVMDEGARYSFMLEVKKTGGSMKELVNFKFADVQVLINNRQKGISGALFMDTPTDSWLHTRMGKFSLDCGDLRL